ncbi:MAG TPA: BrnT family toxin [Aestuariivirgaceae bacterium]|nr:BrnT family toxin [Aestuariivirgaceae bacterium]
MPPETRFEWDPRKAAENLRKHDVAFEDAQTVFEDDEALLLPDPDHSRGEERFVLLGASAAQHLLVVVHCERAHGTVIRIISARNADRDERAQYVERRSI